ncbi:MAG: hypothetical protein ACRD0K_28050 [Egibacteraceae bacterium]
MLSIEEADAALERLGAEHDAISAKLLELEDHRGRKLREATSLEGTTAKRWSAASSVIMDLWARFDTCGRVLDQARQVRARRWWPGISELAELTELLTGPAVPLPAPRTQDRPVPRRISLDEAVAGMRAACSGVVAELRGEPETLDETAALMATCAEALAKIAAADLASLLEDLERDTASEAERLRAASATARGLLEERAELRGRLGAYRAKAARLGYAEDLTLHKLYQNAHRLLWTAPCDLNAAATAVLHYQQSLTTRSGRQ